MRTSSRCLAVGVGGVAAALVASVAVRPGPGVAAPLVGGEQIAHRGGRAHGPDNSLAAISASAFRGADAVELDVLRGLDGRVVCAHDGGVLAGAPTLAEALARALGLGLRVELDLKTGWTGDPALVREVVDQISEHRDRVWVSAFHPLGAWHVRRADPDVALGWPMPATGSRALDGLVAWDGVARWLGATVLEPHGDLATSERLDRWRARGWTVAVYGAPDDRVGELRARGVAVVVDTVSLR